jgi:hypothetical protein
LVALQPGLRPEFREVGVGEVGDRLIPVGEVVEGGDPGGEEALALAGVNPGDEPDVAGGRELLGALGAAPAGMDIALAPLGRGLPIVVAVEDVDEAVAAAQVDRHDLGEGKLLPVTGAENERGVGGEVDPGRLEGVAVGRELEQRWDRRVPGEFGVPHRPPPVRVADEEIGIPEETVVGDGALADDLDLRAGQGVQGGRRRVGNAGCRMPFRPCDGHHPPGVLGGQGPHDRLLVRRAQGGEPGGQRIGGAGTGTPAEDRIELPQQRPLAAGRDPQVGRADRGAGRTGQEEHDQDSKRHHRQPHRGHR